MQTQCFYDAITLLLQDKRTAIKFPKERYLSLTSILYKICEI